MSLFIMGSLAFVVLLFLAMLCVQAIRIEKSTVDIVELAESKVTKLYSEGGG